MLTRRIDPTAVPSGARIRLPSRRKIGALEISRIVIFEIAMSSMCAPSTDSSARPRDRSKTTFEIVIFRKSPSDSVPILMRPVGPSRSGRLFDGPLVSAVHQRADIVSAHQAVRDRDVLRRARESQRVRALQDDGVVVGRIDAAIGNPHIAARVQIDAVPVGVDGQVVDREIVHAGGQNSKVSAGQNRKIAQRHLAAELQRDRFVAASAAFPAHQGLAADQPAAEDRHVLQPLAPDQAVVEMAVSEILELVPLVGLGRIVCGGVGRRLQHGTGFELQREIAAQANRAGHVGSRRKVHRPAARRRRGIDRLIDGVPVRSLAIALRPERLHVEHAGAKLPREQPRRKRERRPSTLPIV